MISAVIFNGVVDNLIMATPGDPMPEGYQLIADPPDWVVIGTPWDGTDFVKPPPPPAPPIPEAVAIIEKL